MAEDLKFKIGDIVQINVGTLSSSLWTLQAVVMSFESKDRIRVRFNETSTGSYFAWRLKHYIKEADLRLIHWLRN